MVEDAANITGSAKLEQRARDSWSVVCVCVCDWERGGGGWETQLRGDTREDTVMDLSLQCSVASEKGREKTSGLQS
jgi:hypothetical protein